MESHDQPAVGTGLFVALQTEDPQIFGMIKVNSFSIRLLTVQPGTPHYLLCTVLRKICACCWMKDSSTGIPRSQHRSFVLPGMKEPSRIYWKGHQNHGMMKGSTAAWPGGHRPFLIFIAATVMIHLGYLPGWNIAFGPWGKHCQTIRMKAKTDSIYHLINQSPFKLLYFFSADADWSTRRGI